MSGPADQRRAGLSSVSIRLRVTTAVIAVLAVVLLGLGLAVSAVFAAESDRNLDLLLSGRVQLGRQLARTGLGPQQVVNRVGVDGVQAYVVTRTGVAFGTPPSTGAQVRSVTATLTGAGRINNAQLTVAVDTSLVAGARLTLRRILVVSGLVALGASAALVAVAVRLALRPLDVVAGWAQAISTGHRGARLRPDRTDTEIGQTASALDEMLDELEGAEARAREAEERTRAFLADAAHELRTPLTGVQAAAETLLHHGDDLTAEQREHLQVLLLRESQRAGGLVADLLAAARLDAGVELQRTPVSLPALVHGEVERARLLAPGAVIEMTGPELVLPLDVDKINSVVRNLTDNALRAAGPAGTLRYTVATDGRTAWLDLWNSGPPVAPADRERVFARMVRLDQARAQDAGGSGLGLAIARGYARAHGGDLTCEDPHGPGALFRLTLPVPPVP